VTVNDVSATFAVWPIGRVESTLTDLASAPRQADEGAPAADVVIDPAYIDAIGGLGPGDEMVLLTWLDRGDRAVLRTHPRGDLDREPLGVFATRSPDRPNPIGLHTVRLVSVDGARLRVEHLEALDGTPVLDIKPVLGSVEHR
jgi:tRNA-Thr(GGU) m(6)t(6)A37 methyltransferase TsaA